MKETSAKKPTKRGVKISDSRPNGHIAQHWYRKYQELRKECVETEHALVKKLNENEEIVKSLRLQLDYSAAEKTRIDNMYQQMDAKLAATRRALAVIAAFDADRWSEHFRCYELQPQKLPS